MRGPETGSTSVAATDPGAAHSPLSRRMLAAVLIVIALSAVVRLVDLDRFPGTVFDEYYYVHDAAAILAGDLEGSASEPWKPTALRSVAHPDLAKLAIACGILVFGDDAWGWRVPAALAGIALVALVFPLARRMGLNAEWSLAALVLTASDPMLMIESRLGVLDMFVALATALSVYLALRYVQSGCSPGWVFACGAALGAAVASKWSGVLAFAAVLVVVAPALVSRRRRAPIAAAAAALVLVPLAVYAASSILYFAAGHGLADWTRLQEYMATFGWGVQGDRPFASAPPTWPFDVHPIWYSWGVGADGTTGLLSIGNLLLWWASVAVWVVLGVLAILRRDWRLGLAPALVGVLYLPWLLTSRQTYIYYMVPVIPFMAIMVATALSRACGAAWASPGTTRQLVTREQANGVQWRRVAAWVFCLACVVVGLLMVPFVIGWPVPFEYYHRLMLFTTWR